MSGWSKTLSKLVIIYNHWDTTAINNIQRKFPQIVCSVPLSEPMLSIALLGTKFGKIWSKTQIYSNFTKMSCVWDFNTGNISLYSSHCKLTPYMVLSYEFYWHGIIKSLYIRGPNWSALWLRMLQHPTVPGHQQEQTMLAGKPVSHSWHKQSLHGKATRPPFPDIVYWDSSMDK